MARAAMKIEFMAGDDIKSAFEEAIRIARKIDVNIEFDFNGISCYAGPDSDAEKGVSSYKKTHNKKITYAFA